MLDTFNTPDNLSLNKHTEDTLNNIKILSKGLKGCEPISGNLLFRMIEKIEINSNTVLR